MPTHTPYRPLPRALVIGVVVATLTPGLLHLLGIDFGTPLLADAPLRRPEAVRLDPSVPLATLAEALRGRFIHALLEWSAVSIAVFTAVLALVYSRYTEDRIAPVLAVSLLAAGGFDVFHTLAATFVISSATESPTFIPFTWSMSRLFHILVLITGGVFVLWSPHLSRAQYARGLVGIGLFFCATSITLIYLSAVSPSLPRTLYTHTGQGRLWQLLPLMLCVGASLLLFPRLYRHMPSLFAQSLWLAMLPDIATELHHDFGTTLVFDSYFHLAHFTKVVAYAVPLCGLVLDYAYAYRHAATTRERLEKLTRELEERARELERTNGELAQFAYVASHDLRAPLRAIDNLSQWLAEDLDDRLTGDDRKHIELLRGRVKRMDALLEALLQYSRAGRRDVPVERVDVAALLAEIIDMHAPPPGFTVAVAPGMPVLDTDRVALQQVLANLIGNAIKHHDRDTGRIDITCEDEGAFHAFTVRDDGPGVAPAFHGKVFEMFQTLKPRDQVEGSGMGLALVKKQVDSCGGQVALASTGERGTAIRFTWPRCWPGRGSAA